MQEERMTINKAYIKECFKTSGVQLSSEALEDIIRELRIDVSRMAQRCKKGNVKRLTSDLMFIAKGNLGV